MKCVIQSHYLQNFLRFMLLKWHPYARWRSAKKKCIFAIIFYSFLSDCIFVNHGYLIVMFFFFFFFFFNTSGIEEMEGESARFVSPEGRVTALRNECCHCPTCDLDLWRGRGGRLHCRWCSCQPDVRNLCCLCMVLDNPSKMVHVVAVINLKHIHCNGDNFLKNFIYWTHR